MPTSTDTRPAFARLALADPRSLVAAGLAGIALGTFAAWADHSVFTTSLGQMVAPWVAAAAAVGFVSRQGRFAAAGGLTAILLANLAYHLLGLARGYENSPRYLAVWVGVGLIAGPLFGLAGFLLRGDNRLFRLAAIAGIGAIAIAEGIVLWGHIDHPEAHATYLVVGAAAIGFVGFGGHRWVGSRGRSVLATLAAVPFLTVALEIVYTRLGIV